MSTTDDARDEEFGEGESLDENFVEPPVRRSTYTPPAAFSGATPSDQDPAVHDDDELASALAEDFSRTVTGSIPIVEAEASLAAEDPFAALFGTPTPTVAPEQPDSNVFEIPSFDERIPEARPAPVFEIPDTSDSNIFEIPVSEPAPEPPVFEIPSWETPAAEPEAPVFEAPAFEAPVFEAPVFEAPVAETPVYEAPAFEAPVFEAPVFEPPVFEMPPAEAPAADVPSYDIPAFESPESAAPAWEPTAWEPTPSPSFASEAPTAPESPLPAANEPPLAAAPAAPAASDSAINEFSTPEEQFAALQKLAGPAGRPWVPERRSMTDRDLMAVLESASGPAGSAGALAEIEKQLILREEEAREYADWEQSMLAVGTPEALAAVDKVRPQFNGVVPAAPATSSIPVQSAEPIQPSVPIDDAPPVDAAPPAWADAPFPAAPEPAAEPAAFIADERPIWEAPAAGTPAWEAPAAETPAWEEPVAETPVWEAPVADTPAEGAPLEEPAAWEAPIWEAPVAEAPATEPQVADDAPIVAEAPAWEAPVAEAPVWETPTADAPTTEATSEVPASEPFVWEMPVWAAAAEESPAPAEPEAPVADALTTEAPAWEAPAAEIPAWEQVAAPEPERPSFAWSPDPDPVVEVPVAEPIAPEPIAPEQPAPEQPAAVEEDPFAAFLAYQEAQTAAEAATAPPATFPFASPATEEPAPEPVFPQHTPETIAETPATEASANDGFAAPAAEAPATDQFWANHAWADQPAATPAAAPEPELPAAWDAPAAPAVEPVPETVAPPEPPEPWIVPPPVAETGPPPLVDPIAPEPVPADFVPPVYDAPAEAPNFASLFEPEAPPQAAPETTADSAPEWQQPEAASAVPDAAPPQQPAPPPGGDFNFDDLLAGTPDAADPADPVFLEPRPFVGSADSERSESVVTQTQQATPEQTTADPEVDAADEDFDEELDGVDDVITAAPLPATGSVAVAPQASPVFRVETSGLEPTPIDRRVGNAARLFYVWFAANSSIVSIAFGAVLLGVGMNLRQAIVATLAGVALSFVPLGFTTLAGKRSSQPTMVVSRAVFGVRGNIVPALISLVTRLFWGAALLWGLAASIASILVGAELDGGLGFGPLVVIGIAGGLIIATVIGYFGYALIAKLQLVVSIVSALLLVGVVALTWQYVDFAVAVGAPDGPWILVVTGAVLVFSFLGLLWANSGSDLARYQRTGTSGAAAMLTPAFGATLPSFLLIAYGAMLAASNPVVAEGFTTNPLDTLGIMLPTWYPVPLIIAASLGLLSGVVVTLYSGGFALQSLGLRMPRQWSTVVIAVLVLAGAFLITLVGVDLTGLFRDVATTLAVPVAAWVGIFAADVMIRSRRYDSPSLLRTGGVYPAVNWGNLSALVVITALGFGFTSATLAGLDWQGYLFGVIGVPASDPLATSDIGVLGALVLGLLVPLVSGVPGIRKQESLPGLPN